ncbi:phosphotransferase [Actinomadura sp. KC216]|uniref:phosphotransferase n=1 Tax=Actinomadura sp. KC216 TaxID=2530370 RepID=UPI0014047AB5|nr:phosphotransferase [Actinomadura sp. KC216]
MAERKNRVMAAAAENWAAERLRDAGVEVGGPVERLGARAWSRQFRIPTSVGYVYFKSSPPAFGHEAALTRALCEWFPGNVPEVLAIDAGRNWMLTADFGADQRSMEPERILRACAEMIPAFTGIQVNAARRVGELLDLGCPDHRLAVLPGLFDELVSGGGDLELLIGGPHGLAPEELERLRLLARPFRETCGRLASFALPETVVHADIWRGNFVIAEGGPLVFDWAESMVAHPFYSLEVIRQDVRMLSPGDHASLSRITDVYLDAWGRYGSRGRLAEAVRLAAAPALVSRALMWRDAISGLDERARPRYAGAVADRLRALLRHPFERSGTSGAAQV